MGAHSTIKITENAAKSYLIKQIFADYETIEKLMDAALYDRLYNCWIVSNESEDNQDYLL